MGRSVTLRTASTTSGPNVRLGTKWPSMTSTWMRSAPAASAWRTCSPKREKSAARIDGASLTTLMAKPSPSGQQAAGHHLGDGHALVEHRVALAVGQLPADQFRG